MSVVYRHPEPDVSQYESMQQADEVKRALELAKGQGPFTDSANENGNGNALHRVCAAFVAQEGD